MLSRERWLLAGQSLLRALRAFQPHHFKRRAIKMVNSPQLGMIEWQCPDTSAQPHIRMWSMSQQHHYHFHSLLGMQTLELFPKYPKSESEKHYFSKKHNRETPLEQHLQSDLLSQVSSSFRSQLLAEPLASQPSFKHLPLINWPTVWNEHLLFFFSCSEFIPFLFSSFWISFERTRSPTPSPCILDGTYHGSDPG